jgi:hypothetical protein
MRVRLKYILYFLSFLLLIILANIIPDELYNGNVVDVIHVLLLYYLFLFCFFIIIINIILPSFTLIMDNILSLFIKKKK